MTCFVVGVDGGGSKTAAVILDGQGRVLGKGQGATSNYHLVGEAQAREALQTAMQQAAQEAHVDLAQAAAVIWALAGTGRAQEAQRFRRLQAEMLPGIPGEVVTDAIAALVGGTGKREGVVVIAGTGAIVYGENAEGASARAGGWGYLLDEGSGYAIGLNACRAIMRANDGQDLSTRLTDALLGHLHLSTPSHLISWLYDVQRKVTEVAALAPLVLATAEAGDLLALEVVVQAAEGLAANTAAVVRRLGFPLTEVVPVVLSGGVLEGNAFYRALVSQAIQTRVPQARPQRPRFNAATGAGLLALSLAGCPWNPVDLAFPVAAEQPWASEQRNILSDNLDTRTPLEIVGLMHLEDRRAVAAVRPYLPAIAAAVEAIAVRMKGGGRLIYVGAGTSGRLGVLDAAECPPTFNTAPGQVVGVIAGGHVALTEAVEEAEDRPDEGAQAMQDLRVGPNDTVVGITASGRTPYVMGALTEARRRGAQTVALLCNLPAPLTALADYVIAPTVGPEVITGSTRLKAGTVQKLVLNMLSTAVMVRLGKTYGNLMVDVQQQNSKLRERARRIVAQACHISEKEAARALERCGGDVKTAIVSTLLHCSPQEAQERLKQTDGNVRLAIEIGQWVSTMRQ